MSSSTPNLNLVLPVGGEHVSRAIINENNTKIDTFAGTANSSLNTLSEQITKFKAVALTGQTSAQAAVQNVHNSLGDGESCCGSFVANATYGITGTRRNANYGFYIVEDIASQVAYQYVIYNGSISSQQLAITPVVAYTETAFSVNTNTYGVAAVPSASIPTVSGRTRVMLVLANFTSSELSASQIPPTVVETSSGNVFILGSPSKTYSGLQLKGLFI